MRKQYEVMCLECDENFEVTAPEGITYEDMDHVGETCPVCGEEEAISLYEIGEA